MCLYEFMEFFLRFTLAHTQNICCSKYRETAGLQSSTQSLCIFPKQSVCLLSHTHSLAHRQTGNSIHCLAGSHYPITAQGLLLCEFGVCPHWTLRGKFGEVNLGVNRPYAHALRRFLVFARKTRLNYRFLSWKVGEGRNFVEDCNQTKTEVKTTFHLPWEIRPSK